MMHLTLILCDTIFVATMLGETGSEMWHVICTDALTGKTERATWTQVQLNAVVCLALCGEDQKGVIPEVLYPIAEEAIKGWDTKVRPIP